MTPFSTVLIYFTSLSIILGVMTATILILTEREISPIDHEPSVEIIEEVRL